MSITGARVHPVPFAAAHKPAGHKEPRNVEGETSKKTRLALQSKSRKAKKWLGQHYMVDDGVTRATVDIASINTGDVVLEVGPGTGVLTDELLQRGAHVVAVEKDKDMFELTCERFLPSEHLEVIHGDVMKWDLERHMQLVTQGKSKSRGKIVANLPYNITTEFLQRILPLGSLFSTAVLMLQDDAARRLVDAGPGTADYRKINVLVKFFSEPTYALFVDRTKYLPPPKFHGAVVKFNLKDLSELKEAGTTESFPKFMDRSFALKRKMLRSSLAQYHSAAAVEDALLSLNLLKTSRPEDLSLEDFIGLHNRLTTATIEDKQIHA